MVLQREFLDSCDLIVEDDGPDETHDDRVVFFINICTKKM